MAILQVNFFSKALLRTVNFVAILPVDKLPVGEVKPRKKEEKFKTLYLLHGVFGSELDWLTGTRIHQWATDHDLAVIMPAGENSFYNDQKQNENLFGQYIGQELVDVTRQMFPLSPKREDTFVAGLSMGGAGALCTGLRYPETFSAIGTFSAALIAEHYPADDSDPMLIQRRRYFEAVFGPEKNFAGSDNDYTALAASLTKSGKVIPAFYMACGLQDSLLPNNHAFRDYWRRLGLPITYVETDGAHEWRFWDDQVKAFIEWLPLGEATEGLSSGHIE